MEGGTAARPGHLRRSNSYPSTLLLLFTLLFLLPHTVLSQVPVFFPPPNVTVFLTVYTEVPQNTSTWTVTNPSGLTLNIVSVTLQAPANPSLSVTPTLPFAVQAGSPSISLLINSSSLSPSSFNATILVSYTSTVHQQPVTVPLNISISCLQAFSTNRSFPSNFSLLQGQSLTTSIKLRSRPYSALNLSITPNTASGDYPGTTPAGVPWQGGGPLLTSSPAYLLFTPTNWNVPQTYTIAALPSPLIYGDRWSVLTYTYATNDPTLTPLASLFTPLNITIVDTNVAAVVFPATAFTRPKNSAPLPLTLRLACQPRAPVTVTLATNAWVAPAPLTFLFTPITWNVTQPLTLTFSPDYTLGVEVASLRFPALQSADVDYAAVAPPALQFTFTDPDPSFVALDPPFGVPGTNLTLTWPAGLTFTPLDPTVLGPPTVACVFGVAQYGCNTSATGFCPLASPATIVSPQRVQCEVPACAFDAVQNRPCYSPAVVSAVINGVAANLATAAVTNITQACAPLPSRCMVGPSIIYDGTRPIPPLCLSASCPFFPSTFSYLPVPVITAVSPSQVELARPTAVSVVLTVLGAGSFSSASALCEFDGVPSPAYAVFASNLTTTTYPYSAALTCYSPARVDRLGTTGSIPLFLQVSLTGQATGLSTTSVYVTGIDSAARKASSDLTLFMVCCLLAFACVVGLAFQHYCCRDCRTVNHRLTGEGKRRGEKGPQMLIDLLEPRVRLKLRLVEDEERRRKEEEREERQRIEERVYKLKADKKEREERLRQEKEALHQHLLDKEKDKEKKSEPARGSTGNKTPAAKGRSLFQMMLGAGVEEGKKAGEEAKSPITSPTAHVKSPGGSPLPGGRHTRRESMSRASKQKRTNSPSRHGRRHSVASRPALAAVTSPTAAEKQAAA